MSKLVSNYEMGFYRVDAIVYVSLNLEGCPRGGGAKQNVHDAGAVATEQGISGSHEGNTLVAESVVILVIIASPVPGLYYKITIYI